MKCGKKTSRKFDDISTSVTCEFGNSFEVDKE